jgi:hypothetical protein
MRRRSSQKLTCRPQVLGTRSRVAAAIHDSNCVMMCTFDIARTALLNEQRTCCICVQARFMKNTVYVDKCARYKHELVELLSFVKGDLETHKHFVYFKLWRASR